MKQKKLKAWLYDYGRKWKPTVNFTKPPKREINFTKELGCKVYEVEIIYKKEI